MSVASTIKKIKKLDQNRLIQLNYEKSLEQSTKYVNMLADFLGSIISMEQEQCIISKIDVQGVFPLHKSYIFWNFMKMFAKANL